MSIARTIGKLPTAVTDNNTDIPMLDITKLFLNGNKTDGNLRTAHYVYADGDDSYEVAVDVRITLDNPKAADAQRHVTVKVTTRQLSTDSVTGLTTVGKPVAFFIGYEVPLEGTVTVAEIRLGLGTAYGLTCDGVTAGVPGNGFIQKLAYLIPAMYGVGE